MKHAAATQSKELQLKYQKANYLFVYLKCVL